ncbi:MAG: hypothetical protein AAF677_06600 [Pseudomonadota bacterium]
MTMITRWVRRYRQAHRQRIALQALLRQNDRILDDMGLVRGEVERALGLPLGEGTPAGAREASRRSLGLDHKLGPASAIYAQAARRDASRSDAAKGGLTGGWVATLRAGLAGLRCTLSRHLAAR